MAPGGAQRTRRLGRLALPLLSLAVPTAFAVEGTLVAGAHVSSASPAVNAGALPTLNVGGGSRAFLQFDLSPLPVGTTASAVAKATLRLWVNRVGFAGSIDVSQVNAAWSESTITFNSAPPASLLASGKAVTAAQWVVVDVTSVVKQWVTSPSANHGIEVTPGGRRAVHGRFLRQQGEHRHQPPGPVGHHRGWRISGSDGCARVLGDDCGNTVRSLLPLRWREQNELLDLLQLFE